MIKIAKDGLFFQDFVKKEKFEAFLFIREAKNAKKKIALIKLFFDWEGFRKRLLFCLSCPGKAIFMGHIEKFTKK